MTVQAPEAPPRVLTAAVIGNPNCGKTTLFNALTGSTQRVGNWPGVTVERKEGTLRSGRRTARVVDLPGIYSLSAHSEDERIARDYLLSREADLVINIVDATNLERNLYLTTMILEMGIPVLVVLNMMDRVEAAGTRVDTEALARALGCRVLPISALRREDAERVKEAVLDPPAAGSDVRDPSITPPEAVNAAVDLSPRLSKAARELRVQARWLALRVLEGDPWAREKAGAGGLAAPEMDEATKQLESALGEAPDVAMAEARYAFIRRVLEKSLKRSRPRVSASEAADRVIMNRILGIPIFLGVMFAVFWLTINVGGAFIDFFDILFGAVFVDGFGALLGTLGAPDWLAVFLAGGVGAGIQTVATFVPIIFTMFLLLSILEDSGYMARAAFVVDRLMHAIGLPGKAFIPMIVGFGCTVPAVMGTRTLDGKRDRLMTVFMAPFMSCGARLPVYALFGAAFFGRRAGLVVFSIYMAGILLAVLTGLLLKHTLFRGEASPFVMELPEYHLPRFRQVMRYTGSRLGVFVRRAGLVIVTVVCVLGFLNSLGTDGSFGNEDSPQSVLSAIGRGITPIFTPMGIEPDNWPASVALFTGIFAKEAVVGTLASLYSQNEAAETENGADGEAGEEEGGFRLGSAVVEALASIPAALGGVFGSAADPLGTGVIAEGDEQAVAEELDTDTAVFAAMRERFRFGGAQAYAYLLFVLIYFPCVAAFGAMVREIGKGYGTLLVAYLTVLAWIVATLFYQITVAHQAVWIVLPLLLLAAIFAAFRLVGARRVKTETVSAS